MTTMITVYLCYVDDSGDSKVGTTLTALVIEDTRWTEVLDAWLDGRREIHQTWGVPKTYELHATKLYNGRGKPCETDEQNRAFAGTSARAAAGRVMLNNLARAELTVVTIGCPGSDRVNTYRKLVEWLEVWAIHHDAQLMIFYDGKQGYDLTGPEPTPEQARELWDQAIRNATPYIGVHRDLEITQRRVLEDVIMQDSRYSQLIQAADLAAYGAFQKHRQEHPEIWGNKKTSAAATGAIRAYVKLQDRWPDDSDHGVYWL